MGYNQPTGSDNTGKIGANNYKSENKKFLHKLIFTPKDHVISTQTLAETQSTWLTDIKQTTGRIFPSPVIVEISDNTGEPVTVEFPNGDKRTIALADYDITGYWDVPDSVVRELFTLNNKQYDAYLVWQNGAIEGRTADGTTFNSKRVKELNVMRRTLPDGSTVQRVMFGITFSDKQDFEEDTVYVNPSELSSGSWDAQELDSLRGVDLTATDAGGSYIITLTVKDEHGVGVEGLSTTPSTDIVATGGTINSITDDGGGTYSLTMADGTSTTVNLVAAASISLSTAFIESNGASSAVSPSA